MIGTKVKTHRIEITGWSPTPLNKLMRMHWGRRCKVKREAYVLVLLGCHLNGVPKAKGRRRVSIAVTVAGRSGIPDADGVLKLLLDGLVRCGALVDDSGRWCELGEVWVGRGPARRTVIVLEDIPDA